MFHPQRMANEKIPRFDPIRAGSLTFEQMDPQRYPCFVTALEAGKAGGTYPTVLSAADEVAVDLFLQGRIGFTDIHRLVASILDRHDSTSDPTLEDILSADQWARQAVLSVTEK